MRIIVDFHIHSKYSRATSPKMVLSELATWAKYKGIDVKGTGDFTHPYWFREIKNNLIPLGNGLFSYKKEKKPKFMLTAEISSIYTQNSKVRKVHTIVTAPSVETVEKINKKLGSIGNIYSDGRPILGLSAKELAKIIFEIDKNCMIIPAHMWTPWFSVFGSKSGFDSMEECYEEISQEIFAGETGLSSDPEMNWRVKDLDRISLVSNSDAHSLPNLGREATVFNFSDRNYSYIDIRNALKTKDKNKLLYTIEFFPEEGKYHFDGHRLCNICLAPSESLKRNNICPACGRQLTIGVSHRLEELSSRKEGYINNKFPGSKHIIPLQEIIAEYRGVGKNSKKVQTEYMQIITDTASEFEILLDIDEQKLLKTIDKGIVDGILRVRENEIKPIAGYDGVYGAIKVFDNEKKEIKQVRLL